MKEYFNTLTIGRRILLVLNLCMILLFIILYNTVGRQKIIRYNDEPLRYKLEDSTVTYSGRVNGNRTLITIEDKQTVTIQSEDTTFGPYTIIYDESAVPDEEDISMSINYGASDLTGVEVFKDKESLFRGAYDEFSDMLILYDENGNMLQDSLRITFGNEQFGTQKHPKEPTVDMILELAVLNNIEPRGETSLLIMGIFLSIVCIVTIIFEDAIFRWNLRFQIRNVENAEPSEWEMFSRWASWILMTGTAAFSYYIGLFI